MQIANDILLDADDLAKSCTSKNAYESEWDAKYAADECMGYDRFLILSWYKCKYCGKWHLTEI